LTPAGFTSNLVADVTELIKEKISQIYWNDSTDKIVFLNGVLEVSTGEFLEHSKEDYITWGLDFNYNPTLDPGPITEWIYRTQYGDESRVQVLRAWLRACLACQGHDMKFNGSLKLLGQEDVVNPRLPTYVAPLWVQVITPVLPLIN
jgi:phage/plasmid-associated DNA primase